jgi:hypothetical protein
VNRSESQADVDRVISNILKKYNLERVPEASNTIPLARTTENVVQNVPVEQPHLGYTSWGGDKEVKTTAWKSPNINFLSPLISSGFKEGSLGGSGYGYGYKDDDLRSIPFTTPEKASPSHFGGDTSK